MKFGLSSIKVDWERFTVPGFDLNKKIAMIRLVRTIDSLGLIDAKAVVELTIAAVAEHGYIEIDLHDLIRLYRIATRIVMERSIVDALYHVRRYAVHGTDNSQWMANVVASMINLYYMEVVRS